MTVSFDRAVQYYDNTRAYPPGVAEKIRDAIVAYTHANLNTRLLELGVGTGLVALPFVAAGYHYVGVDISTKMMAQMQQAPSSTAVAGGYHTTLAVSCQCL